MSRNQKVVSLDNKRLIFLIATVVNLLILEFFISTFLPQPVYAVKYSKWGWEHMPNISYRFATASKEIASTVQYNSDGFQGSTDYLQGKQSQILRVAILGDSEAEGVVDYKDHFATKIEDSLNRSFTAANNHPADSAEVIRAGVYGYEPCQFLRLFESRVLEYKPDVVYVLHNYKFADDRYCQSTDRGLRRVDFEYDSVDYYFRWILGYLRAKSQLLNFSYLLFRDLFGFEINLPGHLFMGIDAEPSRTASASPSGAKLIPDLSSYIETNLTSDSARHNEEAPDVHLTRLIYRKINDLVRSYGGTLRVVATNKTDRDHELKRMLQEEGLLFFDLARYLDATREGSIRFPINGHWNRYGNHLAGKALSRVLIEFDIEKD